MENKNYIKSPMVYQGNKFKLLDKILPLFPEDIKTFVDLFGGSGVVAINVEAEKIIYNEYNYRVQNIFSAMLFNNDYMIKNILEYSEKFNLKRNKRNDSKQTQEIYKQRYLDFRDFVNKNTGLNIALKGTLHFLLHIYSFHHLIRFNKKGEFNASYGYYAGDRTINIAIELLQILKFTIEDKLISTRNCSFDEWVNKEIDKLKEGDFIYCDPPYLNTTAVYNENRLTGWERKDEIKLLEVLDNLNDKGIKWGMSNTISGKEGQQNEILKEWMKKYQVNYFDKTYKVFGYSNKKNIEVYITNYKKETNE